MLKLVCITALSALVAAGAVVAAVTATTYLAGDFSILSTVSAVAVVLGIVVLLIALMERANARAAGVTGSRLHGVADDRDVVRLREELRSAATTAGAAPARHPHLPTM